jgi:hypothetical protein
MTEPRMADVYVVPPDIPVGLTIVEYRLRRPRTSRRWRLARPVRRHQEGD